MLTGEAIMEIRILARRGMGIRAISREFSLSRSTVRRYLRGEALGTACPWPRAAAQAGSFRGVDSPLGRSRRTDPLASDGAYREGMAAAASARRAASWLDPVASAGVGDALWDRPGAAGADGPG